MTRIYGSKTFFGLLAIAQTVLAQGCSSTGQYNSIDSFSQRGCLPSGYFQAQDIGQTTPSSLNSICAARCTSYGSSCQAYVGQLFKAADSGLYTGQCFYYPAAAVPSGPATCADAPATFVAGRKDNSLTCLSSSSAVASAFCSSYLSYGTVTVYTSTVTPRSTVSPTATVSSSTTTTSTSGTTTTTVLTSTSTILTTTSTTQTSTATISSFTTTTTTSITTTTTTTSLPVPPRKHKRAVRVATPACLTASPVPASRISSACSCFSITSQTVTLVSTAVAITISQTTTTSTVATLTTLATSTSTVQSTTTTLTTSTNTVSTATTTTTTSISTSTAVTKTTSTSTTTSTPGPIVTNGFFDGGFSPWTNTYDFGTNVGLSYTTDNPQSPPGALAVQLINPLGVQGQPYTNVFSQNIMLQLGKTYILTFAAKLSTSFFGCTVTVEYDYSPMYAYFTSASIPATSPTGRLVVNSWNTYTGTFTAPTQVYPAGSTTFGLKFTESCPSNSNGPTMVFDSISIVPA